MTGAGSVRASTHAAPRDAAPDDVSAWEAANPSLSHIPELREAIERESKKAALDSNELQKFRALRLNAGVSDTETQMLLDPDSWERIEVETLPAASGPYCLGVDLGGASAMTATVAYWPSTGRLEARAWFPRDAFPCRAGPT